MPGRVPKAHLRRVHVVPHTHWDREWWNTFAGYRATLIELTDGLLDILDANPDYRSFMFDGQVAPIDDYLNTLPAELRDKQEQRIRQFIADGRIQIGPWYTLCDQYLVSGETVLRNLEHGVQRARELGGLMDVVYCPDQFGLIQELPKVANYVGLTKAVGERGMKRSMPGRFTWRASDGSEVDTINIKDGYYHGKQNADEMREIARRYKGEPALFLAGYDHSVPTDQIAKEAAAAGVRMSSLPEYWNDLGPNTKPFVYTGEIRSAGDKNILPNVISNRVDQRIEVANAERSLERYAEPLAAFCYDVYPSKLLGDAWMNQFWNSTHDSACASNIDEVVREVRVRARQSFDTAEGIVDHSLKVLATRMSGAGMYVWNPSNFERDFYVKRHGINFVARSVPGLGWAKLQPSAQRSGPVQKFEYRFEDQPDLGDTYTFDPGGPAVATTLPLRPERRVGEDFTRVRVAFENKTPDHRTRIVIKLPGKADSSITDTAFGHVVRPAVPDLVRGRDTLNGYPAGKFIVAGGLAILVDRVAEYEILPDTNELAITLVRSHGALSVGNPSTRVGGAGPQIKTYDTQMYATIDWELAVMPWTDTNNLPWKEWEQFMLPGRTFTSQGGGDLAEKGTYFKDVPQGILSAVLPQGVRTFGSDAAHKITMTPLHLEAPLKDVSGPSQQVA